MTLSADREQIAAFISAIFVHADEGTFISLRGFDQVRRDVPPFLIEGVKVNGSIDAIIDRAHQAATRCANAPTPKVFAPPVATFHTPDKATTSDLANGVAISVEIDEGDTTTKRRRLEHLLGAPTIVMHSGGDWADPDTGEIHPKLHLHWRLSEPTRTPEDHETLRQARRLAALLVAGDPTGAPVAHPLRMAGSWNLKSTTPRLARIIGGNPASEVHLTDALETLQEAIEAAGLEGQPARPSGAPQASTVVVVAAMEAIPNPDAHYDQWIRYGYALHRATGGSDDGRAAWDAWARKSPKFDAAEQDAAWDRICSAMSSAAPPRTIGAGTIFFEAAQHGWTRPAPEPPPAEEDPGYWASLEASSALSQANWHALESRETGRATHAPAAIKAAAGKDLLWRLDGGWDEATIPPRPWIARGYLMRGAVTVLSGPGSAGKSSLVCAWAAALTLGRDYHGMRVPAPLRAMVYNVEDDQDEQKRRFSAAFRQFDATPYDPRGRLQIVGPTRVGTLLTMQRDGTLLVNTPVMDEMEDTISILQPDVVFLDPFVELHDAEENDNTMIRAVMARFRTIAASNSCAICLLHHSRKGTATPGDPDSLRGASAIVGAARVALTLNVMTEEEAGTFGIPKDHRRDYFRLDGAKSNYAPIHDAEWFERIEHRLENDDGVAAATPWKTPSTAITPEILDQLLLAIAQGAPNSQPWSDRLSDAEPRSFRHALTAAGILERGRQKSVMQQIMASGAAMASEYSRPGKSDKARGIRTADGRPGFVQWV